MPLMRREEGYIQRMNFLLFDPLSFPHEGASPKYGQAAVHAARCAGGSVVGCVRHLPERLAFFGAVGSGASPAALRELELCDRDLPTSSLVPPTIGGPEEVF